MRVSGDRRLKLKNCYLFSLFLETSSFLLKCNSEVCRTVTHTQWLPAPIDICILFSSLAFPFLRCLLKSEICSAAFLFLLFQSGKYLPFTVPVPPLLPPPLQSSNFVIEKCENKVALLLQRRKEAGSLVSPSFFLSFLTLLSSCLPLTSARFYIFDFKVSTSSLVEHSLTTVWTPVLEFLLEQTTGCEFGSLWKFIENVRRQHELPSTATLRARERETVCVFPAQLWSDLALTEASVLNEGERFFV